MPAKGGARSANEIEIGGKSDRFRFVGMVQEDHRQPVYGAQFCYWFQTGCELLATVGSSRVSVYQCDGKPADGKIETVPLRFLWAAHDENATESYYSVAWGVINNGGKKEIILALAGLLGVVRVLSAIGVPKNVFRGHGGAVNELLFHPRYPHILFSASKDHAIRVWDCLNSVCLARLAGVAGHRDEVLTLDVILPTLSEYSSGCQYGRLVSGSLDHMICVWNLDGVLSSYSSSNPPKKPIMCHYPIFSTLDLHADYVDCCRYLPAVGVVASRAAKENCVLLWRPLSTSYKGDVPVEVLTQLEHKQSALWWLKFGCDAAGQILAAGTQAGRISIWRCNQTTYSLQKFENNAPFITTNTANDSSESSDADDSEVHSSSTDAAPVSSAKNVSIPPVMTRFGDDLRHPRCETAIRQVAVSKNGTRLVAVSEDGRLWRWDMKQAGQTATTSGNAIKKSNSMSIKSSSATSSSSNSVKVGEGEKRPSRGRPPKNVTK